MPSQEPSGQLNKPSIYMPHGASGGGGEGGGYVFADLAELDSLIAKWTSVRDRIDKTGKKLGWAIEPVVPPADDPPSVRQANAYVDSLTAAQRHHQAMLDYANGYVERLTATREQYIADEQAAVDRLRRADGD